MEKKMTPIKILGAGQCPECTRTVSIIQMDIDKIPLDEDGIPRDVKNLMHDVEARCDHCGTYFKCIKVGMGFEIVHSDLKERLSLYRKEEKIKQLEANPFGR